MKVKKPWGEFLNIWHSKNINIKIITLKPNSRLSLQSHKKRQEYWFLLQGHLFWQKGSKIEKMKKGKIYFIPKKAKHRLFAKKEGGKILEVSFGKFEENDIIRYEDDYGRIKKEKNKARN